MFDHFLELFVWSFQLLFITLIFALSLRFRHEPVFLSVAVLLVANVLQPYHSVGEFGCLLAVLPLWSYLYKYCRLALPTICVLLAALVLTPLFYYMWLQPGTANANFYFAACMVYAVGQILLITDWLNAHSKREYLLRVGQELTLSSGQKLVLIQS
ncbi:phosphatidylinositol glycan, class U [Paragonimus westermani]|uniref:Phosphatidylinositol glycan, class U n=1 Tax=Paragonimus westermani TaxID=34504 RepID=A0A5J4NDB4_9TREM|nr:phosphatidylinositol glycan, class U [Paragonimus westermani]